MLNGILVNAAWIRFKLCLSEEGSGTRKAIEANIWQNYLCDADLLSNLGFGTVTEKIVAQLLYSSTLHQYRFSLPLLVADVRVLFRLENAISPQRTAFCSIFKLKWTIKDIRIPEPFDHRQSLCRGGRFHSSWTPRAFSRSSACHYSPFSRL